MSLSYAPELLGIGPYSSELAAALTGRGHAVRVITSFPFYPTWRVRVPPRTRLYRRERVGEIAVTRCRIYVPQDPSPIRRLLHELSWVGVASVAMLAQLRWADVWVVVTPSFGSAVLGAIAARMLGANVHVHIQDLVPDVALESGQLKTGFFRWAAHAVARWTYRSFRSASVLSESMATGLRRYTDGKVPNIVVAPNWTRQVHQDTACLPPALGGRQYAVYAGSSGRKQDLQLLSETAELLMRRGGPTIAVLGDGPGHEALRAADRHLLWLGLVDDSTYAVVVREALAGIVTMVPGVGESVVPSKLAGYLAAGCPVIVAADARSEAVRVVERAECGFVLPPGRPDLLADVLVRLAAFPEEGRTLGTRGKAYAADHWDKERTVDLLNGALLGLAR